ncbi:MAG: ferredoxin family protein [Planctomycetota bacterium]
MPHVVTGACFGCKYTDCVVVCPADCFHEGDSMLYIDPDECIDCGMCPSECPVEAIYPDHEVPRELEAFIELNREMSQRTPVITEKRTPLANT